MRNLLLSTDFSANATHAAEFGYRLARQLRANVILCNVIDTEVEMPQSGFVAWPMEGEDILKNYSDIELLGLKKHLEHSDNHVIGFKPEIRGLNYFGTLEEVMKNTAKRYSAELIVMGTHTSGSLRDFLLSNHNRNMIVQTTVPLLLVPPLTVNSIVQRIAFATDLKQIDVDLDHIYHLIALARPIKADIVITHISDDQHLSPLTVKQHEALLAEISNKANYPHIYYKFLNNSSAEEGLEWLCEHEQIDILAMVPRKRNFIEGWIKGSLTQKMAKHLSIPLLVFPPK